ncbi:hypothetical protein LSH36_682g01090 [Paralvinella palmiformis]|uniref:Uncharacterized protein n=1 Tax=Paralvinella palmiformis TaxID=53620 RepID=A0AAD9MTP9_9ANNE|nr:hypothetical protein LSH36_682g01090 [Paralvinella palmiformis]
MGCESFHRHYKDRIWPLSTTSSLPLKRSFRRLLTFPALTRDYGQQFDKMEGVDVAFGYWSKSLANLCEISHDDVKRIVCELTQTTKNAIGKGYKFFWDSYIHNLEVRTTTDGSEVQALCYRSQRKNEKPHQLTVVPPRTHDFACRQISDIMILKPTAPDNDSLPQKRKCYGVSCDVYNPINVPLSELRIRDQLMPTLVAHDPESQWLHLWNMEDNPIPVKSQFGTVPRGCVLSYQAPVVIGTSFTSVTDPPDSIFPDFDTTSHLYTSLEVSADESFCRQLKVISSPTKSRSSDN